MSIQQLVIMAPAFLFALTIHEFSHGYVAFLCGDPTAKYHGRLTLNPLKHLDPLGTLAIFIIKFGWAKPVPIDPRNFRNPKRDTILVSLAGVSANFLTMFASVILLSILGSIQYSLPPVLIVPVMAMLQWSVVINWILGIFNLIPIPPLDGSKVLMELLPPKLAFKYSKLEGYGFFIILILALTGVLGHFIHFSLTILKSLF